MYDLPEFDFTQLWEWVRWLDSLEEVVVSAFRESIWEGKMGKKDRFGSEWSLWRWMRTYIVFLHLYPSNFASVAQEELMYFVMIADMPLAQESEKLKDPAGAGVNVDLMFPPPTPPGEPADKQPDLWSTAAPLHMLQPSAAIGIWLFHFCLQVSHKVALEAHINLELHRERNLQEHICSLAELTQYKPLCPRVFLL